MSNSVLTRAAEEALLLIGLVGIADVIGQLAIFTIPAFEVHSDREIDGRRYPRDDLVTASSIGMALPSR